MVRAVALVVVLGAVAALLVPVPVHAEPQDGVAYQHPVDADIVDAFRPPATRFGPGNRGIKYGTEPGDRIGAAADGVVVFAGQVGGHLHVTVGHPDGRLTSYSGVGEIHVRLHEPVLAGQLLASAVGITHVGVREHGHYVDPEPLFDEEALTVRLVPESPLTPTAWTTPGQEAAALYLVAIELGGGGPGVLDRLGGAFAGAGGWLARGGSSLLGAQLGAAGWALGTVWGAATTVAPVLGPVLWHLAPYALGAFRPELSGIVFGLVVPLLQGEVPALFLFAGDLVTSPVRQIEAVVQWWHHRQHCTPADIDPDPPDDRRVALLVAGLDSTSDGASIGALRTGELGYEDDHVIGFSYAGGRTPGRLDGNEATVADTYVHLEVTDYDRSHSSTDLSARGRLLADLLVEVAEADPDATVDLYAHSQGGIVTRLALRELESRPGGSAVIDQLGLVATMATPHQGADLALLSVELSSPLGSSAVLRSLQSATGTTMHPRGTNLADLARGSDLLVELGSTPLPEGPDYLSLSGRGDLIVLDRRTRVDGARQVTLPIDGLDAHSAVPGHPASTRELALGLAGMGPTCRGFFEAMVDHAVSESILLGSSSAGAGLSLSAVPIQPIDIFEPVVRW